MTYKATLYRLSPGIIIPMGSESPQEGRARPTSGAHTGSKTKIIKRLLLPRVLAGPRPYKLL
jgi:hypothetical protein